VRKPLPVSGPSSPVFPISLIAALIAFGVYFDHEAALAPQPATVAALHADLARASAAPEVQQVARWAVDSLDHAGLPFVVIDKARARLFAFDPQGHFRGSAPILLGASHEDGPTAPATPAGRFVADTWLSAHSDGIVWVHAGTALLLHEVPSAAAPGHGLQRLASGNVQDKRISDGSLHVAGDFYREHLSALRSQVSVAYVLPELLPWQEVFIRKGFELEAWLPIAFAHAAHPQAPRRPS
jgi:hypothetical protein